LTSSDITFSNDNPSPDEVITISATVHTNGAVYDEINVTPLALVPAHTGSGFYVDADYSVAQSFTATTDGYLAAVEIAMADWGSDSAYAQVEIQTDSGSDTPSGTSISSTETQDWPSSISWERIKFSNPAELIAGNKYWIVVTCSDSYTHGYLWVFNNGSVYAGGGASGRDNDAPSPSWATESATDDCLFKAYLCAHDTVVRFFDGDPGAGGIQIGANRHLPPIPASGTKSASVQWTAIAGSHDIYVVVDPADLILESNETNNKAYKSLSVGGVEVISFTVTDYDNDSIQFGDANPGEENHPADWGGSLGAVTITVGSETSVSVNVQLKGTDFTGASTISIENVKYDGDADPTGASVLTTAYVTWYTVTPPLTEDNITQVYYWITIPPTQSKGGYTSTFYYQAIKTSP